MDRLEINQKVLRNQVSEIEDLSSQANEFHRLGGQGTISASYSEVSGLDQMGQFHGAVVDGGVGSAVATLQKYAQQVSWLRDGLLATERALVDQEGLVDRAVQIADAGGSVGGWESLFPERPDVVFEDFEFPTPVVSVPSSLAELSAAFSGTDSSAVSATADVWRGLSQNASRLAEGIRLTAWDMDEINKARAIEQAVDRALEIADAADRFSVNAQVMATSVESMGAVAQAGAFHVALAELAIAFIEDPVERAAAEQEFLSSFMGSTFPAAVESVVPSLRNLMDMDAGGRTGGALHLSMNDIAGGGGLPGVEMIQAGSRQLQSLIDDPRGLTASSFGHINQQATELAAVGSPSIDPRHISTTAAGGAGLLGNNIGFESPRIGAFGPTSGAQSAAVPFSGSTPGNVAASMVTAPGFAGAGGTQPGRVRPSSALRGSGTAPHVGTVSATAPNSGLPIYQRPQHGQLGVNPETFRRPIDPNIATNARSAGPTGVGARAVPPSSFGVANPMNSPVTTAGGGSSTGTGRGAVPFGGMPLAANSQDSKKSKVKTVTSPIEEEGNMKALLGDLPAVLPGAIGAWARG
ncbi:hypothetical protein [Corynebacterium epidermidicanis]|uniref:PPE family protein n=1 Tax=Corynebacterium epidermidicanis TaxID=1050174 RepID=A0A0G3GMW5_9CORY|nr:hypothetical protein [Corynebacterium epidermidicanis]AKK02571.1 hypothetical protein CEPID_03455 [Corynebacterium epidermidicanis]